MFTKLNQQNFNKEFYSVAIEESEAFVTIYCKRFKMLIKFLFS